MKKIFLVIGLMIMALLPVTATGAANAITCSGGVCIGGEVRHATDDGYDPAIIVFCNYGDPWDQRRLVAEGTSSKADCGVDTDQIYIRDGEELWCTDSGRAWEKEFDATGRHKISDLWNKPCVLHKD